MFKQNNNLFLMITIKFIVLVIVDSILFQFRLMINVLVILN
jgi:hypothetical protein